MKFKEVSLGFSRKISDGNYGSAEVHVGTAISLCESDIPSKVIERASVFLKKQLEKQLAARML